MNKTALITGASTGIGRELARVFAREKYDVVLVARSKDRLDDLAKELSQQYGINATPLCHDLLADNAVTNLMTQLADKNITIDVLINNAGFGLSGEFVKSDLHTLLDLVRLNISVLTELTHVVANQMMARKEGQILNLASTAAFQPGPYMAVYYASKAYVLSLSEALHYELRPYNITVTALCPGATKTEFFARARMADTGLARGYIGMMDAEKVAKAGFGALQHNKRVKIPGIFNFLLALSSRITPHKLGIHITSYINRHRRHVN